MRRQQWTRAAALAAAAAAAALVGVLYGGRVSAENGIAAAREALASGDAARSVALDEAVAGRSGLLMVFDPGAEGAARYDADAARIAWAQQLSDAGHVDAAVAVLREVDDPGLVTAAAATRTEILVNAATTAVTQGHASEAVQRLDEAALGAEPASMVTRINALRAGAEVSAAQEMVAAGRYEAALALLDKAAAAGAGAAAAPLYPSVLLRASQDQIKMFDFQNAAATLQRLLGAYGSSGEATTARALLRQPQRVTGTLVDAAGRGVSGRVRLASHYSPQSGGYLTSGPFYFGTSNGAGDFSIDTVSVGGPYVLEYFRGDGWQTLVDPRTFQPANPVTVRPLTPDDLTFIVVPG